MLTNAVIIIYIAGMLAVGFWFSRRSQVSDGKDYMLAGQGLGAPVLAGTMLTTFVGSGSVIGGASFVYQNGPLVGIFFFLGTIAGALALGFIAKRVRQNSFSTVPQLLTARFGNGVGILGTVIVLLAFIGITGTQFTGAGYIFSLLTPLTEGQGAIAAFFLIVFLAMSGGLKSVSWTDFLSALLILGGLLSAVAYVYLAHFDGFGDYTDRLPDQLQSFTGTLTPLQILGFFLPLFLLILGDQNMHQRLAAAKDAKTAQRATYYFFGAGILMIAPIIFLASFSRVLLPNISPDMAILGLADSSFTPEMVGAIILATALALVLTTGSSYLLASSGSIVYDLLFRNTQKRESLSGRQQVLYSRLSVMIIAVLAFVIVQFFPTFLSLQMYAYTMYGAAVTPVVLAALFWKRVSVAGAASSMIVGSVATIAWEVWGGSVNSVVISFPLALFTLVAVSLTTKRAPMVTQNHANETSTTTNLEQP